MFKEHHIPYEEALTRWRATTNGYVCHRSLRHANTATKCAVGSGYETPIELVKMQKMNNKEVKPD